MRDLFTNDLTDIGGWIGVLEFGDYPAYSADDVLEAAGAGTALNPTAIGGCRATYYPICAPRT